MKSKSIFRILLAIGTAGISSFIVSPASAHGNGGQAGTAIPVYLNITENVNAYTDKVTEINVTGRDWRREGGVSIAVIFQPMYSKPVYRSGNFSVQAANVIQKYVTSEDLIKMGGTNHQADCGNNTKRIYTLIAGSAKIRYAVCGNGYPAGNSSFTRLVRGLDLSTK